MDRGEEGRSKQCDCWLFGGLAAIYGPDDEEGSNEEKNYEVCAQEDQNASWRCWRVGIVILIGGGEDG
jgi:hypothetical protein